jgi:hypothetical protein
MPGKRRIEQLRGGGWIGLRPIGWFRHNAVDAAQRLDVRRGDLQCRRRGVFFPASRHMIDPHDSGEITE